MKSLSILAFVLFLGACSETPVAQSSFGYSSSFSGYGYRLDPMSIDDPRMKQPSFYMDGEDSIPWLNAVPQSNNR